MSRFLISRVRGRERNARIYTFHLRPTKPRGDRAHQCQQPSSPDHQRMALSHASTFSLLLSRRSSGASPLPTLSCRAAGQVRLPGMASMGATAPTARISETFDRLRKRGKVAFIPYICAGYPDLWTTFEALKILDSCGSDIIELGMPYSDPLADGPVIQAAATHALAQGTTFDRVISMLKEVIPQISCPIALFTYYNPIMRRGVENFMTIVGDAGVHGLVVPDVPLEETAILREEASKNNIELVLMTSPTTPKQRMASIVDAAEGFVYLVSSVGVSGAASNISGHVQQLIQEIKEVTTKPVAVGFGISKLEHVKQVAEWGADGVIVGSAVVKVLGLAKTPEEGLKELETYVKFLKSGLP